MNDFITYLAWIFGCLATGLLILRIIATATYTEMNKLHDAVHGYERSWPLTIPAIIAIVCWTWVFSA